MCKVAIKSSKSVSINQSQQMRDKGNAAFGKEKTTKTNVVS